jgi:hypothetical protein
MSRKILYSSKTIFAIAFVLFFLISVVANILKDNVAAYKFGFEYGKIAASIARGDGYANVFTENSGPTAWMLPLNTGVFALVFYIFGEYSIGSFWVLVMVNSLFWALSAVLLWKTIRRSKLPYQILLPILMGFTLLLNYYKLFVNFMDVSLINLLAAATIFVLYGYFTERKASIGLLVLAVLLPLSAPSLFLAYALILLGYYLFCSIRLFSQKSAPYAVATLFRTKSLNYILLTGLLSVATLFVWSERNYFVLHAFMPSKSNFWYEFYQANILDEDGILDNRTITKYHPSHRRKSQQLYLEVGEKSFVEHYKELSVKNFDLANYLEKLQRRLRFAFLYSSSSGFRTRIDLRQISQADLKKLEDEVLINKGEWTSLHLQESEFSAILASLQLENEVAIHQEWNRKRALFIQEKSSLISVMKASILSLIPSLCIVFGLIISEIRRSLLFVITSLTYVILLIPYILVSHDIRYQTYGIVLQTVLIYLTITQILKQIQKKNTPHLIKLSSR